MKPPGPLPAPPKEVTDGPTRLELEKIYYQAQVDVYKLNLQASIEEAKTEQADQLQKEQASENAFQENEYTLAQNFYSAYLEVAKAEAGKSTLRAEFVQKAAAAISAAYVAVIGLSFGLGDSAPALPFQGLITTVFLGISIFLSTAYAAYITRPTAETKVQTGKNFIELQQQRLNTFILWSRSPGLRRVYLLQSAIISLGIGIMFLPAAYLPANNFIAAVLLFLGLLAVFLLPLLISLAAWAVTAMFEIVGE